jgi:hypothetical protein
MERIRVQDSGLVMADWTGRDKSYTYPDYEYWPEDEDGKRKTTDTRPMGWDQQASG